MDVLQKMLRKNRMTCSGSVCGGEARKARHVEQKERKKEKKEKKKKEKERKTQNMRTSVLKVSEVNPTSSAGLSSTRNDTVVWSSVTVFSLSLIFLFVLLGLVVEQSTVKKKFS